MSKFKNPISPRQDKQASGPWGAKSPTYDQERAGNLPQGTDYGVGFDNPVGVEAARKSGSPIPKGHFKFSAEAVINAQK